MFVSWAQWLQPVLSSLLSGSQFKISEVTKIDQHIIPWKAELYGIVILAVEAGCFIHFELSSPAAVFSFIFSLQISECYRFSYLTLSKKVNKLITQNTKLCL